jgi:hypothetical protein
MNDEPSFQDTTRSRAPAGETARWQRNLLIFATVSTLVTWAIGVYGVANAPWVSDLSHVIDPASARREGTLMYLLGPSILPTAAVGWLSLARWFSPVRSNPAMQAWNDQRLLYGVLLTLWLGFFLCITLFRVHAVLGLHAH